MPWAAKSKITRAERSIDPVEPDTIFARTKPSAVFRSRDAGERWEKLTVELAEQCPAVIIPRVTALVVDPEGHRTIWAGIEVDGVRRSLDGGGYLDHHRRRSGFPPAA